MAAAEAIGFACTYDACSSSKSKLLCIYDKVLVFNDKIYDEGNSAADICATCAAQQKCTAWLCQDDYQPAGDIPQRVCADGLTNDLAATALHMHNYYRGQISTGWMVDKKNGYAPTAKEMPALVTISAYINSQLDQEYVDETTYFRNMTAPGLAIESWAKQVSNVGVGKDNIYTVGTSVDSYANLAFDGTTQLGCAVEVCVPRGSSVVVCEYDGVPQDGNVIYTIGRTCSGCAAQGKKCEQLHGLCV
ncbi:SCP-like protein [Ancylostoma duodenale]|uniref:SCP-like protein n=1 Tax=Ancylostoma duodenale TaxID=51022 RepID=A0A0C2G9V3_9BILA|nr:SCP-like protein [Ancylostoma duodenale]